MRRVLLALLIAALVAVVVSIIVARRLARPLRRTADAAHALAAGRRDVRVPVEGPAEVAEVASALNSLAGSLSRSEGRQRDFLLSVSHDLRTPLTGISGYAESLASGVVPAEETARVGGVVLTEAKRLERLVGDLLDLARLGADRPSVDPGAHRPRRPRPGGRVRLVEAVRRRRGALRLRPDRGPGLDRHRPGAGAPARRRPPRERAAGHAVRAPGRSSRCGREPEASTSSRCATAGRA